MKKLYRVMEEFLNKKNEIIQGELLYQGYSLDEAISKFRLHDCKYNVNGSKNYAREVAYDYIYICSYNLDREYNLDDEEDIDLLNEIIIANDYDIIVSNDMNNLKKIRILNKMSQSELAAASGVNFKTLQDYEQGRRDINKASISTVLKLANALGTSMDLILK